MNTYLLQASGQTVCCEKHGQAPAVYIGSPANNEIMCQHCANAAIQEYLESEDGRRRVREMADSLYQAFTTDPPGFRVTRRGSKEDA